MTPLGYALLILVGFALAIFAMWWDLGRLINRADDETREGA